MQEGSMQEGSMQEGSMQEGSMQEGSMQEGSMQVQLLDVTIYAADGGAWRTEEVRHPTWNAVELAVRRLDRFRYPFIWLYRQSDVDREQTTPDFSVLGGAGEFAMDAMVDGTSHRYYDQARGDDLIEVWRSDQGATFEAKYCCSSLEAVLRATRYFCEHGRLDPSLNWQPQPS
jgi:hypothetical protein